MTDTGELAAFQREWEARGVDSFLSRNSQGVVRLHTVRVTGTRRQGTGTAFMEALTRLADEQGWTVDLTPGPEEATSAARLYRFYARFGFVRNRGLRPELSDSMYRDPRGSFRMFSEPNRRLRRIGVR
jgi:GNAT superfamily N-acetyltransferase